jgi:hypothetical protein
LVTGNTDYLWLANPSCYVSAVATQEVYNTFDIGDRFGYYIDGGHGHCEIPSSQRPAIEAFVDRFLIGDTTVNTDIPTHPYPDIPTYYWTEWWGNGDPYFPLVDREGSEEVWIEAECATVGAAWNVRLDTAASNESYAVPKPGLNSETDWPADSGGYIYFPFTVSTDNTFYIFGRVNCSSADSYSLWRRLDDKSYERISGTRTDGWKWIELYRANLTAGEHTFALGYRLNDPKLDKICISDLVYRPGEKGEPAESICVPDTTTKFYSALEGLNTTGTHALGQNYPNPFYDITTITFEIFRHTYVSLKVYSSLGEEIAELAGKECSEPYQRHLLLYT